MNRFLFFKIFIAFQCLIGICSADVYVTMVDENFERTTGKPNHWAVVFPGNAGKAKLTVTSGYDERTPVSSAKISLNGETVIGRSAFNMNTYKVEQSTFLQEGENILEVEMASKPGAAIRVQLAQSFPDMLSTDAVWSGDVQVNGPFTVTSDANLTILPGTRVKIAHYRGYREPEKRIHFIVKGGILAEGTAEAPIYFTSDAKDPQNGDWSMMRLLNPTGPVVFSYCVFEFAQQGLNVWSGDVEVKNCVFRIHQ